MPNRSRIMFSINRLSTEKRAQVLSMLVEGNSVRATSRMAGVAINTVQKLLLDIGDACAAYQDQAFRDLPCKTIQCDEIWSFVYSKQRNVPEDRKGEFGVGDVWTWVAIDADSKLCPSWFVGSRSAEDGWRFLMDLKGRLANRVQITTDGHGAYPAAIGFSFGTDVDWAVLQKHYGQDPSKERRYSPAICIGIDIDVKRGDPDPSKISTSYVERQNLTMRMGMRRFTRLTNGFSKKLENHVAAVALHFAHYNLVRPHKTLANPYPRTPAMAAGVADHVWSMTEIAALLD
jgi:IS1 family transposase